ncbi:MAG: hypothetical protein LQ352_002521 [Teloschistes flavicans]|nr:MAG: hypothetical protein LQ352_002521 [Teloschistes flavicans]
MPAREVVDLCLSTDDEVSDAVAKLPKKPVQPRGDSGYGSLSDRLIDIDDADGPRKRRKMTLPSSKTALPHDTATFTQPAKVVPPSSKTAATDGFLLLDDDDPIVWTSSPNPKPAALQDEQSVDHQQWATLSDSDGSLPDEQLLRTAQQRTVRVRSKSLQDVGRSHRNKKKSKPTQVPEHVTAKSKSAINARSRYLGADATDDTMSGSDTAAKPKEKKVKKPKLTDEEKAARVQEKEEAKAAARALKTKEKEEEKERKRLLKEEQAREKQKEKDRAEANKLKLDKKLSTPEMIVDLPISMDGSTVDTQIRETLKNIGVEVTSYQSYVPNLIKWRRKVEYRLDPKTGCREKLPTKEIDLEKHVMYLMSANEFVEVATADANGDGQTLDQHVRRIKNAVNDCIPIYLIEGLDVWMRKNRNARNRNYQAAVLGQSDPHAQESSGSGASAASKRKGQRTKIIDEDMIDDALLRLQVANSCLVHHTAATVETAEWVMHFTEQISQIPYRQEQMRRESMFCMDSGQVKCGKDAEETYVNMLLVNVRVTAPIAYGIAERYPDVVKLAQGLEEKGPLALEHLKSLSNQTHLNQPVYQTTIMKLSILSLNLIALLPPSLLAHSDHDAQAPLSEEPDWAIRHMTEEHHISNFDPGAFFTLHDFDYSQSWTADEIRRMYGLDDESNKGVDEAKKAEVVRKTLELFDRDADGVIEREEWMNGWRQGKRLQDFGLGPGHHGDDEYEYEIHHFEKFHDENTKEEDLIHPEDIEHFRKHDEQEAAAEHQEQLDRMPIVEQNIPRKFRRY